jgi:nicotinamide-nucleotide amidase
MLATAESCTGGMLASLLTDVQGVAHAFDRGFVTYTNEAKNEMLGVPMDADRGEGRGVEGGGDRDGGRRAGALAAPTSRSRSPALPTAGDEPGLVHFACARAGRKTAHREEHFGPIGRGATRVECMRVGDRDDDGDAVMAKERPVRGDPPPRLRPGRRGDPARLGRRRRLQRRGRRSRSRARRTSAAST